MPNDPGSIGSLGIITGINKDSKQIYVDGDDGRSFHLIIGVDMFALNPKEDPLYNELNYNE